MRRDPHQHWHVWVPVAVDWETHLMRLGGTFTSRSAAARYAKRHGGGAPRHIIECKLWLCPKPEAPPAVAIMRTPSPAASIEEGEASLAEVERVAAKHGLPDAATEEIMAVVAAALKED